MKLSAEELKIRITGIDRAVRSNSKFANNTSAAVRHMNQFLLKTRDKYQKQLHEIKTTEKAGAQGEGSAPQATS